MFCRHHWAPLFSNFSNRPILDVKVESSEMAGPAFFLPSRPQILFIFIAISKTEKETGTMGLFRAEVGLLQLYLLRQSTPRPARESVSPPAKSGLRNRENGRGHIFGQMSAAFYGLLSG